MRCWRDMRGFLEWILSESIFYEKAEERESGLDGYKGNL